MRQMRLHPRQVNLSHAKGRVRYLARTIPMITQDPDRGRLLMILLYWKLFDGIEIPPATMKQILERGTNPESLGRLLRFVLREMNDASASSEGA